MGGILKRLRRDNLCLLIFMLCIFQKLLIAEMHGGSNKQARFICMEQIVCKLKDYLYK